MQKKLTRRQKVFHFICFPILCFIAIYLFAFLLNSISKEESLGIWELVIPISIGLAIFCSIVHWIKLLYPSTSDEKKSFREYIKEFVSDRSPFNRLMVVIYLLSIILAIVMISFTIIKYL